MAEIKEYNVVRGGGRRKELSESKTINQRVAGSNPAAPTNQTADERGLIVQ